MNLTRHPRQKAISIYVLQWSICLKRDGWIAEIDGVWILRFRYDFESWDQNPMFDR